MTKHGYSVPRLAKDLDLCHNTIYNWLYERNGISETVLKRVAGYFEIDPEVLLQETSALWYKSIKDQIAENIILSEGEGIFRNDSIGLKEKNELVKDTLELGSRLSYHEKVADQHSESEANIHTDGERALERHVEGVPDEEFALAPEQKYAKLDT